MTLKEDHTAAISRYKNQLEQLRSLVNGEIEALLAHRAEPTCLDAIAALAHSTIVSGYELKLIAKLRTNYESSTSE